MVKRVACLILVFWFMGLATKPAWADGLNIHFFWSFTCPHCAKERLFLQSLQNKYPQVTIKDYEVTLNRSNQDLLEQVGLKLNTSVAGVPFTVVGRQHFIGYLSDETTGWELEKLIQKELESPSEDLVSVIREGPKADPAEPLAPILIETTPSAEIQPEVVVPKNEEQAEASGSGTASEKPSGTITLPLLGEIVPQQFSLPLLTFVLALLDGFNPCAMWTLLFLISLLLGMQDRKRMWVLGTAFIVTSALVYFLFMAAWLNLFLFLGLVTWVRWLIGLVALGAAGHNLRDYWANKSGGCAVTGDEKRQRVFEKIRAITQKRQFILALGGIMLLAIAVNLVELICSAGLPAIYTQILSLSNLPTWQYYLYLVFYILIFMLDDLFVFFTAMITLQTVGIQSKYARYSRLIGGVLMLLIGLLLLFKPEWLMFG